MKTEPAAASSRRRAVEVAVVGVQIILGSCFLAAYLLRPSPLLTNRPPWLSPIAALLACVALGLGAVALVQMRGSFRVPPGPRADGRLVCHGVYRRMRHPMYTAVLILVAAVSLHQPDAVGLAIAALNVAFYLSKARYEESLLLRHYPAYSEYVRTTWGVVPGLGRWRG